MMKLLITRKILRKEFLQPINPFQMRIQMMMRYQNNSLPFHITKPWQLLSLLPDIDCNQARSVRLRNSHFIANVDTLRLHNWRTKGKASKQLLLTSLLLLGLLVHSSSSISC